MHIFDGLFFHPPPSSNASRCSFLSVKNDKFSHVSRSILCVRWYLHVRRDSLHCSDSREGSRWKMEIDLYLNDAQHEWLIAIFYLVNAFFFVLEACKTLQGPSTTPAMNCVWMLFARERPISVNPQIKCQLQLLFVDGLYNSCFLIQLEI